MPRQRQFPSPISGESSLVRRKGKAVSKVMAAYRETEQAHVGKNFEVPSTKDLEEGQMSYRTLSTSRAVRLAAKERQPRQDKPIPIPKHQMRRSRVDDCTFCQKLIAEGTSFAPPHDPSYGCESGKHTHCSCDTCF